MALLGIPRVEEFATRGYVSKYFEVSKDSAACEALSCEMDKGTVWREPRHPVSETIRAKRAHYQPETS